MEETHDSLHGAAHDEKLYGQGGRQESTFLEK
jgi:hypothetical protein